MNDELRQAIDTIPGLVWSALPDGTVDQTSVPAARTIVSRTRPPRAVNTATPYEGLAKTLVE